MSALGPSASIQTRRRFAEIKQDLVAGRESFACHRTQYTASEMESINNTLAHVWKGVASLRPWAGTLRDPAALRR
jgi:hypothetical protein